jgi:hypothetical protein
MEGFSVHWEFLIEPWALLKDLPAGSEVLTIAMVESCCNHQLHLPQKKTLSENQKIHETWPKPSSCFQELPGIWSHPLPPISYWC